MSMDHPGGADAPPSREQVPEAQQQVTLADLIARVEAAEGPSRELDADLHETFTVCEPPDCHPEVYARVMARVRAGSMDSEVPTYTASLDAALVLVERKLLGADFDICFRQGRFDTVRWFVPKRECWVCYEAATIALAVCLALLRALSANAKGSDSSRLGASETSTGMNPETTPLQAQEGGEG